jgi:hypothetical protein
MNLHRIIFLALIIILMITDINAEEAKLEYSDCKQYLSRLDVAFNSKDTTALQEIFEEFAELSKPISSSEFDTLSDLEKETYKIYEEFYNPLDSSFYPPGITIDSTEENGVEYKLTVNIDKLAEQAPYYIVQNQIEVMQVDSIDSSGFSSHYYYESYEKRTNDTIRNFRPKLNLKNKEIIFLDKQIKYIIYEFINDNREYSLEYQGLEFIWNVAAMYYSESEIDNYTAIETRPMFSVVIDKSMQRAIIAYSRLHNYGAFLIEKKDNKWVRMKS